MSRTATARPAATVLLVRDGKAGLEVFMVMRHRQIDFAGGALVFPGGKVDEDDRALLDRGLCRAVAGLDEDQTVVRIAAIREAFEECGLMLARVRGEGELIDSRRLAELDRNYRHRLHEGKVAFSHVIEAEGLELACDTLVHFAHWITPEMAPKRFDTQFFIAQAPPDQLAAHDGQEIVDSLWIRPPAALAEADAGRRTIIWPTRMNLEKLNRHSNTSDALRAARQARVVTVLPRIEDGPQGKVLRIPPEADYDISETDISSLMRG